MHIEAPQVTMNEPKARSSPQSSNPPPTTMTGSTHVLKAISLIVDFSPRNHGYPNVRRIRRDS